MTGKLDGGSGTAAGLCCFATFKSDSIGPPSSAIVKFEVHRPSLPPLPVSLSLLLLLAGGGSGTAAGLYRFATFKPESIGPDSLKLKANRFLNSISESRGGGRGRQWWWGVQRLTG